MFNNTVFTKLTCRPHLFKKKKMAIIQTFGIYTDSFQSNWYAACRALISSIDLTVLLIIAFVLPTFLLRSLEFISPFKCFLIPSGKSMTPMTHSHSKKIYDIHIEKIQFCRFFHSFDIVNLLSKSSTNYSLP